MLISSRIGEAENKIKIHFKHISPKILIGYDLICSYPKIFFSINKGSKINFRFLRVKQAK